MHAKSLQSCPTIYNSIDSSLPGFSTHGNLQARYWSELPFPPPGDFPNPGIKPVPLISPELAGGFLTTSAIFSSVHFSSFSQSRLTLYDLMDCSTPDFPVHHQLPKLTQTHVHWVDDTILMRWYRLILRHALLLLPSILPSIRVFSNESVLCIRWPKYWSFSFSISPSNEYSGLISFRMNWLGLCAVHGILKSLLQHHSSKASILWHSALFIV